MSITVIDTARAREAYTAAVETCRSDHVEPHELIRAGMRTGTGDETRDLNLVEVDTPRNKFDHVLPATGIDGVTARRIHW